MKAFYIGLMGAVLLAGCAPYEHGHYIEDVSYANVAGDPPGTPILFNGGYGSKSTIAEYNAAYEDTPYSRPAVYSEPVGCGLDCGPDYLPATPVLQPATYTSAPPVHHDRGPVIDSGYIEPPRHHGGVIHSGPVIDAGPAPLHVESASYVPAPPPVHYSAPVETHVPLARPHHRPGVEYVGGGPVYDDRPAPPIAPVAPPPPPIVTASTSSAPPIQIEGQTIHVQAPPVFMNAPMQGGAPYPMPYGGAAFGGYGMPPLPAPAQYGAYAGGQPGYAVPAHAGAPRGNGNCYTVCNPTVY